MTALPPATPLPLFVYGTLLDQNFTTNLLEHPVGTEPATLPDFELLAIEGFPFPTAFFAPGESIAGRLYRDLTVEDYTRLDYYEGVHEGLFLRIQVDVVAKTEGKKPAIESAFAYVVTDKILRRHGIL